MGAVPTGPTTPMYKASGSGDQEGRRRGKSVLGDEPEPNAMGVLHLTICQACPFTESRTLIAAPLRQSLCRKIAQN